MKNATFRIIVGGKVKAYVIGNDGHEAIDRAKYRYPSVKRAKMVMAEHVRTHVEAKSFEGRVYHGPWADDEEQAFDAFNAALRAQFPNVSNPLDSIATYSYGLER